MQPTTIVNQPAQALDGWINAPLFMEPSAVGQLASHTAFAVGYKAEGAAVDRMNSRFRPVIRASGVAVISIAGAMSSRGAWWSSGPDYLSIQGMIEAVRDSEASALILDIDSPGGHVSGIFDLANMINALDIPVVAAINDLGASGGYILAAAADQIVASPTSRTGSIGVIMAHVDQSKLDAEIGLKWTPIFAGAHKNDFTPHAPPGNAEIAHAQGLVNHTYGHMIAKLAEYRGADPEIFRATEAQVYHADEALSLGLIDKISGFNDALAELESDSSDRATSGFTPLAQSSPTRREFAMSGQPTGGETSPKTYTEAELSAAVDAASQSAKAEAQAGIEAAVTAERERSATILGCEEAKTRPALAHQLAGMGMPAEQAAVVLAAAAVETPAPSTPRTGTPFEAAMGGVPNPDIDPDAGGDGEQGEEKAAIAGFLSVINGGQ